MTINSLEDVRPGDIMIAGQSTAPAKVTVYFGTALLGQEFEIGPLKAGHAAIVVPAAVQGGPLRIVEAMPEGARIRNLRSDDWCDQHLFFRLPEDYPGQALDAAAIGMAMIGTPYSILSYVYLALFLVGFKPKWLAKRINRRHPVLVTMHDGKSTTIGIPVEAICSVLVEQAWTLAGKTVVKGTYPQVVTPGLLGIQLWNRFGVERGYPES